MLLKNVSGLHAKRESSSNTTGKNETSKEKELAQIIKSDPFEGPIQFQAIIIITPFLLFPRRSCGKVNPNPKSEAE
ncbi:hypothetical protein MLD38_002777 [Melastoma candidum]|uniref:Uncharacterized protein n=1 Tax=Melastoma candidum TaxID=119954 RepID=A0ACB9S0F6_9MYRT|nr:hypothetical protein MLD38_002777 [Melastoma candidum]